MSKYGVSPVFYNKEYYKILLCERIFIQMAFGFAHLLGTFWDSNLYMQRGSAKYEDARRAFVRTQVGSIGCLHLLKAWQMAGARNVHPHEPGCAERWGIEQ